MIYYFGYGANRTLEMMRWITGKDTFVGKPAVLHKWQLCLQKLSQVPMTVVPFYPKPGSLRDILGKKWGNNFETYVIKPGEGSVVGTLWELTVEDRELVKNWERVGPWYGEAQVKVDVEQGGEADAVTECLGDGQTYDRVVNGIAYKPFLLDKQFFESQALHARVNYFKRLGK